MKEEVKQVDRAPRLGPPLRYNQNVMVVVLATTAPDQGLRVVVSFLENCAALSNVWCIDSTD